MILDLATVLYVLLVIAGLFVVRKGKIIAFVLYLLFVFIGAGIILSHTCDDIFWVGKIVFCK